MLQNLIIITTSLLAIFAFSLGIFSLWRNPKARVVQLWFLTSMAVTIWAVGYLLSISAKTDAESFFYLRRLVYVGASLIPILTFHFITTFLFKHIKYRFLIYFGYIVGFLFLVLINFTDLIIKGVLYLEDFGRYEEVTSVGFKIFLAYFLFYVVYSIYLLAKGYKENDGIRRHQLFFMLLAAIIAFVGGVSNFVSDLIRVYPYGQMIVWLYPIFITYGIFIDEIKIKIKF